MPGVNTVDVCFLKWPDAPHWRYSMTRFAEDEYGAWLGARAGVAAQRGLEPPITFGHDFVKLVSDGSWATPLWNAGGRIAVYVDIVAPPRWDGDRVTIIDLDLDVVRLRDGTTYVDDEDEFLEHQRLLGYPPRMVDGARAAAARQLLAVERGDEPYGSIGPQRLAEWVASAGS